MPYITSSSMSTFQTVFSVMQSVLGELNPEVGWTAGRPAGLVVRLTAVGEAGFAMFAGFARLTVLAARSSLPASSTPCWWRTRSSARRVQHLGLWKAMAEENAEQARLCKPDDYDEGSRAFRRRANPGSVVETWQSALAAGSHGCNSLGSYRESVGSCGLIAPGHLG